MDQAVLGRLKAVTEHVGLALAVWSQSMEWKVAVAAKMIEREMKDLRYGHASSIHLAQRKPDKAYILYPGDKGLCNVWGFMP